MSAVLVRQQDGGQVLRGGWGGAEPVRRLRDRPVTGGGPSHGASPINTTMIDMPVLNPGSGAGTQCGRPDVWPVTPRASSRGIRSGIGCRILQRIAGGGASIGEPQVRAKTARHDQPAGRPTAGICCENSQHLPCYADRANRQSNSNSPHG